MVARCSHQAVTKHANIITVLSHFLREDASLASQEQEGWLSLLQDLRKRGATQVDLIVTDGHEGLLAALGELFTATPRQRWQVA